MVANMYGKADDKTLESYPEDKEVLLECQNGDTSRMDVLEKKRRKFVQKYS